MLRNWMARAHVPHAFLHHFPVMVQCTAHVSAVMLGRCGRCLPGSGVMVDLTFAFVLACM